jgi:hypothetical protein
MVPSSTWDRIVFGRPRYVWVEFSHNVAIIICQVDMVVVRVPAQQDLTNMWRS